MSEQKSVELDLTGELTTPAENQSASKSSLMSLALSNPMAREWFQVRQKNIRPWTTFIDTKRLRLPSTLSQSSKRVVKNVDHFQSNYLFVFIGLVLYCLFTSPFLIVAVAASLGACYIMKLKNEQGKLKILGHELSLAQQYTVIALISFPFFYISGAGSAIFWVLGVSFFIIMLHAILHVPDTSPEEEFFELQMEQI